MCNFLCQRLILEENIYKIQARQLLLHHLVRQDCEPGQLLGHRLLDLALLREEHLQLEQLPLLLLELGAHALHHGCVVTTKSGGFIQRGGGSAEESLTKNCCSPCFKLPLKITSDSVPGIQLVSDTWEGVGEADTDLRLVTLLL